MRALLIAALLLSASAPARAADAYSGGSAFSFLSLDAGARAVALGGAYTALAYDSNALLYNPAGLARVGAYEATAMHNAFVQGLKQDYLSFAARQGWGASVNRLDFGSMSRATLSQPDGTGGTFGVTDLAVEGGYGRALTPEFALGAGAKLIRETIDTTQANALAADVGALYAVPAIRGLALGVSVLNIGPDAHYSYHSEKLPLTWRAGAALRFPLFKNANALAFDVSHERADKVRMGFGLESVYDKFLAVRLGVTTRNDAGVGITAGLGWIWKSVSVDYAIVPFGALGTSNRISATVRWGAAPLRPAPTSAQPVAEGTAESHFVAAQRLIETGELAQAKKELDAAYLLLQPNDRLFVLYHERTGTLQRYVHNLPAAKASYGEAIRLAAAQGLSDPVVADAYTGYGLCLVADGDAAGASVYFKKALEIGASPRASKAAQDQLQRLKK